MREWLGRSFAPRGRWRWYAAAVGIVLGLNVLALLLALLLGVSRPSSEDLGAWPEALIVFPFYLLLIGATEESGWRGFAMPRLTERWGVLGATAVLGLLIAIWHLPLVVAGSQAAVILGAVFASQFLFTWLQAKTDGSVPVVMVAHASQGGLAGAYIGPMLSGSDETLELSLLTDGPACSGGRRGRLVMGTRGRSAGAPRSAVSSRGLDGAAARLARCRSACSSARWSRPPR